MKTVVRMLVRQVHGAVAHGHRLEVAVSRIGDRQLRRAVLAALARGE